MAFLYSIIFLWLGIVSVILFHANIWLPVWASVAIFLAVTIFMLRQFMHKKVGVLMLLLWLVYALPFIHIVPYLWFDFDYDAPLLLWGLAVNPYMLDEQIIKLTAMIGAVGGLGIAFGVSLNYKRIVSNTYLNAWIKQKRFKTLPMPVWIVWVIAGVSLSWLAAPQETIFTAAYTTSSSFLQNSNFSSAWMISYVFLLFVFCDALVEPNAVKKNIKRKVVFAAIAFVVIFLQLLRGDRESAPLVAALFLIYFYWAAPLRGKLKSSISWNKLLVAGFILLIVSMVIGAMRSSSVGLTNISEVVKHFGDLEGSGILSISNILHGTWSAVLLTPLSVAGDYINGQLPLKLGQTYLDLLLSAPPGFIADSAGYVRPIDAMHSLAWEMRYGLGGTHASVAPFVNFRMIGVFFVPALWAYILAHYEKGAMKHLSINNLALLGTISMASPHWLWYGEKYGMNALIIWFLLSFLYRVRLSLSHSFSMHPHIPHDTQRKSPKMSHNVFQNVKDKIIVRIKGGLGNQLFCYAAARRLASANNAELVIDHVSGFPHDHAYKRQYQLDHFNIPCRKATPAERLEPLGRYRRWLKRKLSMRQPFNERSYVMQEGRDYDPRLLECHVKGTLYLEGYWQSEQYFKDVEEMIRSDLRIKPPSDAENLEMAARIRDCLAVAVHVRFFDAPDEHGSNNAPEDYYARAVAQMENLAPGAHYFVFSDQPDVARGCLPLPDERMTLVTHNRGDANACADLWLMTQSQHFIVANSTFSWWGAWLAEHPGKQVIAPGAHTINVVGLTVTAWGFQGLLPKNWIII